MTQRFYQGQDIPIGGALYHKKSLTRMWGPISKPFECESREGVIDGQAGDWLAEDGYGGFYPIGAEFHATNYERVKE